MRYVPQTRFRREMRKFLRLFERGDLHCVTITVRGIPKCVAMSISEYERLRHSAGL
jgi:prevent-host-death family protein